MHLKITQMAKDQEYNFSEQFTKAEKFINENKKSLSIIIGSVLVLGLLYFSYQKFILGPREVESAEQMYVAERYFETDSLDKAINGDGNFMGFAGIIDEYSGTKSANLANYYLGICYLKKGNYDLAIEYLESFNSNDELVSPIATGAIGDAYTELGDLDKAADFYSKACRKHKNNFTTPIFLMKLGLTYENLNKPEKALETYKTIKTEYTESTEAREIDKYIARVEAKI